jgi:hypothetical protein
VRRTRIRRVMTPRNPNGRPSFYRSRCTPAASAHRRRVLPEPSPLRKRCHIPASKDHRCEKQTPMAPARASTITLASPKVPAMHKDRPVKRNVLLGRRGVNQKQFETRQREERNGRVLPVEFRCNRIEGQRCCQGAQERQQLKSILRTSYCTDYGLPQKEKRQSALGLGRAVRRGRCRNGA